LLAEAIDSIISFDWEAVHISTKVASKRDYLLAALSLDSHEELIAD
jgi:hypothetical protein